MTSEQIDRVFGRARLQMVTGAHVEVFREAAAPGESRRYTKRFLKTEEGDYAQWTEREWRVLARLIGHGTRCVPDVVQYDRDVRGTKLVQTYDAGATVDQWATLLPVERGGHLYAHAFDDCAHWWALAHHCLVALDEIHTLQVVHLDVKGDNICIPIAPTNFDPAIPKQAMFPTFRKLALIDFAFSLVSGESLTSPLPIGWQQDYDYQSPRLLHALEAGRAGDLEPTEDLDWRCDMYSLCAMLKRYLPPEHRLYQPELASGWTMERYDAAKSLILRIRETHDRDLPSRRPHAELIAQTSAHLGAEDLEQSLERGWTLARDAQSVAVPALPLTPITRLAPSIRLVIPPRDDPVVVRRRTGASGRSGTSSQGAKQRSKSPLLAAAAIVAAAVGIVPFLTDSGAFMRHAAQHVADASRTIGDTFRERFEPNPALEGITSPVPALTPQAQPPRIATAATEPKIEVAGAAVSGGTSAKDANNNLVTPARSSEASVAASERLPLSAVPLENPRTSSSIDSAQPPSPSTQRAQSSSDTSSQLSLPSTRPTRSSSAASSLALPNRDLRTAQRDAHRFKPMPRSTRIASAPSPSALPAGRTSNARHAEPARRTQHAHANKALRPTTFTATVATRGQQPLASKRTSGTAVAVSSRLPPRKLPTPTLYSAASASATAVVQPAAPPLGAKATVATSPKDVMTVAGPVPQNAVTPSSPAQSVVVASGPSQSTLDASVAATPPAKDTAMTSPVAPPVEIPRGVTAPNAVASVAERTTIVEPSRAPIAPGIPMPRESLPPPPLEPPRNRPTPSEVRDDDEYLEQGQWTLASVVPRTSAEVQAQIARVLWFAANAHHPAQERAVIDAAAATGVAFIAREIAPREARRLHEEARHAYWSRRHVPEALDLELKAFGANPNDPEIAGNLAFLHLKLLPAQPERARQLALHAIGMRNAQYPAGRTDDWTTFAIASALTGRQSDARHALYASLALSRNLDRSCRTALGALATFGHRMREPVEALMLRLHAQGRADDSPYCAWPPSGLAGSRYQ